MILFRSLSKFPCSLLCVVRFLLFVDEWIGSPQSGSEKPQVLLRIPDYEACTWYGNLLFLLIVKICIYIFIFTYWHTYVTIHLASSAWYTNYSPHESATTKNKVLPLYLSTVNIFQHFKPLLLILRCRETGTCPLPTCSINSLMLLKSCLGFLKSVTLVLQQQSCFFFFGIVTDGFFFRVSRLLLLFVVPLKFLLKEVYPLGEAHNFFQHGTVLGCTWLLSCKVMRKDQKFLDCQQKNLSTS